VRYIKLYGTCFLLCLLAFGCADLNHTKQSTPRSGPYPENYKEIVSAWLDTFLAYPQDVKDVRASRPEHFETDAKAAYSVRVYPPQNQGDIYNAPQVDVRAAQPDAGYFVYVYYTPKNQDGTYAAPQVVWITIRNGKVVSHSEPISGAK
jgi:hypothetical protein